MAARSLFSPRFGGSRSTRTQISAIASLGYRVVVIHDDDANTVVADELRVAYGAQLIRIPAFFDLSTRRLARPGRFKTHLAARRRFMSLMNELQPCAIFVHGERPLKFYLELQGKYRFYYCLHDSAFAAHGSLKAQMSDMWFGHESLARRALLVLRRCLESSRIRQFEHVIVNSRYLADVYGLPGSTVLYPPVPLNGTLESENIREGVLPDPPRRLRRIVFVGRLEYFKGPQDAVALLDYLPADYEVVLIGDGILLDEYRRRSEQPEMRARLRVLGPLPHGHVLAWLASAGVAFVPSLIDEAFGASGVEAFIAGTPAVAYRVGGIPEWCREPAGVLVERGDVKAAAAAILDMTRDESTWTERSRVAPQMAELEFGYKRFLAQLRDLMTTGAIEHHP